MNDPKKILWWGRFSPDYSRNSILRNLLRDSGYILDDFRPASSFFGGVQARFAGLTIPDAVWVPAFRQRDFHSARRFADRHRIPLIFDPLISSWDKVVFERKNYLESSAKAKRLQQEESRMFSRSDLVIADTELHARFFIEELGARDDRTCVVPVGTEEKIFQPQPYPTGNSVPQILFYGSFISLQGPEVIVEAATQVPEARWTLLGDGPLREQCEQLSKGYDNIVFEQWCPYERLSERIGKADILLGIFGSSAKAGRVIPNKLYQSIASGRPVITRHSEAYPQELRENESGIFFIEDENSEALAAAVRTLLKQSQALSHFGQQARKTYERFYSETRVRDALLAALEKCLADHKRTVSGKKTGE